MTFEDPKKNKNQQNDDMKEDQTTGSLGGEATDEISETDFEEPTSTSYSSDEDISEDVE